MRLLHAKTLEIHEFLGDIDSQHFPRYAILSHTWGEEECSLRDMSLPEATQKAGFKKIKSCCEQAVKDGLQWAWVDTCCIDKTSTAELSEAINSMFRWYRQSATCYVYLADVQYTDWQELANSRWLTRGWTLQELIAPREVRFYDQSWCSVGLKSEKDIQECLTRATGIDASVLLGGQLEYVPVARKMSWAASRSTTRVEDSAYCLLGLFDVNMPLLYGEGRKAFRRLQQEIMKISDDHSLFIWGPKVRPLTFEAFSKIAMTAGFTPTHGLLAESAVDFKIGKGIHPINNLRPEIPPVLTDNGLQMRLPIIPIIPTVPTTGISCGVVSCTMDDHLDCYLAIPLVCWGSRYTARCASPVLVRSNLVLENSWQTLLVKQPSDIPAPNVRPISLKIKFKNSAKTETGVDQGVAEGYHLGEGDFRVSRLLLPPHATLSSGNLITLNNIDTRMNVPHAVVITGGPIPLGLIFGGNAECRDGLRCAIVLLGGFSLPPVCEHELIPPGTTWLFTEQELEDRLSCKNSTWADLPLVPITDGQQSRLFLCSEVHQISDVDAQTGTGVTVTFETYGQVDSYLMLDFNFTSLNLISSGHQIVMSFERCFSWFNV